MKHTSEKYKDLLIMDSLVVGWGMGVIFFIVLFGLLHNVQLALFGALFFGCIFGAALYYARTNK